MPGPSVPGPSVATECRRESGRVRKRDELCDVGHDHTPHTEYAFLLRHVPQVLICAWHVLKLFSDLGSSLGLIGRRPLADFRSGHKSWSSVPYLPKSSNTAKARCHDIVRYQRPVRFQFLLP